jgi:hypothetical protein
VISSRDSADCDILLDSSALLLNNGEHAHASRHQLWRICTLLPAALTHKCTHSSLAARWGGRTLGSGQRAVQRCGCALARWSISASCAEVWCDKQALRRFQIHHFTFADSQLCIKLGLSYCRSCAEALRVVTERFVVFASLWNHAQLQDLRAQSN